MGWAIGYDTAWRRDVGYGVPAECDHPDCHRQIDRGLSHVCGGQMYGGDNGCGLYFCSIHRACDLCPRCQVGLKPFAPKPDLPSWVLHKLTHPSWLEMRAGLAAPVPTADLSAEVLDEIRYVAAHHGADEWAKERIRALGAWLRGDL